MARASKEHSALVARYQQEAPAKWRLINMGLLCVLAALLFQIIGGSSGFLTYLSLQRDKEEAMLGLEVATAERLQLEQKVQNMRSGTIDGDLLEEHAKQYLGLANPKEKVVITDW